MPCIMWWPGRIPAGSECRQLVCSLDFYRTFAEIAGAEVPNDRIIDSEDIRPLMFGEKNARTPRESFVYFFKDNIEAIRSGKWKLHVRKRENEVRELYDLESDIGETTNLYDQYPEVVRELESKLQAIREDIGDEAVGMEGANCRPIGRVDNPDTLTHYDPEHPYIIALYDLTDAG